MPKTTKRAATKRAARIAKAHATELPKLQVQAPQRRPGTEKRAPRGLGRYPWLTGIIIVLVLAGLGFSYFFMYTNHVGLFAPPPTKVVVSPCSASSVVNQLKDTASPLTTAQFNKIQHAYTKAPAQSIDTSKVYCVGLNTSRGLIVLELDPKIAPNTVNNFVYLAKQHFYDGMKFHRVVPNFVIQTGDPKGNGSGGPGYKFNDEKVQGNYTQGCVAMANNGVNTNGSQFFICTANDTKTLKKSFNLFGHVVQGMNVALKIQGPGDSTASKSIKPDALNYVTVVAEKP